MNIPPIPMNPDYRHATAAVQRKQAPRLVLVRCHCWESLHGRKFMPPTVMATPAKGMGGYC